MNDEQLLRYSRHTLLPEIGIEGQKRLLDTSALINRNANSNLAHCANGNCHG